MCDVHAAGILLSMCGHAHHILIHILVKEIFAAKGILL